MVGEFILGREKVIEDPYYVSLNETKIKSVCASRSHVALFSLICMFDGMVVKVLVGRDFIYVKFYKNFQLKSVEIRNI